MRIETPGLDRLTAEVKALFSENVADPRFRMPCPGASGIVLSRATAAYLAESSALSVSTIDMLITRLHAVEDIFDAEIQDGERSGALRRAARGAGISDETARELLVLVGDVKSAIRNLVARQMDSYSDAEVGTVLVDLFRIDYEEFDSSDPTNTLDYNCDDYFPQGETPRDALLQLTQLTVIARLMKSVGRQLMLAWIKAQEADEAAWAESMKSNE